MTLKDFEKKITTSSLPLARPSADFVFNVGLITFTSFVMRTWFRQGQVLSSPAIRQLQDVRNILYPTHIPSNT